jgi:hypothetical protein
MTSEHRVVGSGVFRGGSWGPGPPEIFEMMIFNRKKYKK